jgi:hypothetical protein
VNGHAVLAVVDAGELDRITTEWLLSQARRNQEDNGSFTWTGDWHSPT